MRTTSKLGSLMDRFPAFRMLGFARQRRITFQQQTAATDCGAACLAMILTYHGCHVRVNDVREVSPPSRFGTDAHTILETGRRFGLRSRGVKVKSIEHLKFLDPATILHWGFNHFVVLERMTAKGAWLVDPALGRRFASFDELDAKFTGVALLFEPGEEFERRQGTRASSTWQYFRQLIAGSGVMGRILVTSLVVQAMALVIPATTAVLVDRVIPRGDSNLLLVLAAGAAGLVGFKFLASLIRSFLLLHLRTRLDARMTTDFLDHLVSLPYLFFQQRSAGDLMMRLNSNTTIREILTSGFLSGVLDGSMVSLYLVLLFVFDVKIGLLVLVLATAQVALFLFTRRRQRDLMSQSLQAQAESRGYEVQMLAGIETMKAAGAEERAVEHWSHLFVRELNVSLDRGRLDAILNSLLDGLRTLSPLAILVYGGYLVLTGNITLGLLLALTFLAQGFLTPLGTLVATSFQVQLMASYLDRIRDVMETPPEQEDGPRQRPRRLRGRITLERVTFAYAPMLPPALEEVSLEIPKGSMIAVVGASGSGKSTLAGILGGLYQPLSGRVLYDGINLRDLDLQLLRSRLGFVAQSPYLFGVSIRENIALHEPGLPLSRITEAARIAEIHDDIAAMPMGYETLLADGGVSLSGGQRQRIALARALARRPRVLVLDEATSALDTVVEKRIQQNLAELRCTRVVIAHRLSTVQNADRIVVLERGRIVEQGVHEELMETGPFYGRLVAAQLST